MIRRAEERDLAAVAAIENANFSLPWSYKSFYETLGYEDCAFLVCESAGEIAGFGIMRFFPDEAELYNLATAAECRRRGVGGAILSALLEEAGRRGAGRALLEVRQSNAAARALYKKLGFQVLGVRAGYYDAPREDAIIMEKVLFTGQTP